MYIIPAQGKSRDPYIISAFGDETAVPNNIQELKSWRCRLNKYLFFEPEAVQLARKSGWQEEKEQEEKHCPQKYRSLPFDNLSFLQMLSL